MRVLVTNDDGVHAPGLAAITRALHAWSGAGRVADEQHEPHEPLEPHEVVVVAPLANHSGASAALGTVYERESVAYRRVQILGAEAVPAYGVDASPALAVLVGVLGGFGPRPDLVVSGINSGANVGRSVLHSGTVGAALAGAQLGIRGLAVSLRAGFAPEQWETASAVALAVLPALCAAPPATVLNLNVPSVPLHELRGVRRARISPIGIVEQASGEWARGAGGPETGGATEEGEVRLVLGAAVPTLGHVAASEDPDDDAALVASGFAALTPIVGVHEDRGHGADGVMRRAISDARRVVSPHPPAAADRA